MTGMRFSRFFAALSALLMLAVAGSARADEPIDGCRKIISAQIEAFLNDDAETAYSFASPAIQTKFQDKDTFFAMVKKSYSPVYRPGNYAFGRAKSAGDYVVQEVIISGTDGKDWTAVYSLQKQEDASYRINGVQIVAAADSKGI